MVNEEIEALKAQVMQLTAERDNILAKYRMASKRNIWHRYPDQLPDKNKLYYVIRQYGKYHQYGVAPFDTKRKIWNTEFHPEQIFAWARIPKNYKDIFDEIEKEKSHV
jgi:hypothetical protein